MNNVEKNIQEYIEDFVNFAKKFLSKEFGISPQNFPNIIPIEDVEEDSGTIYQTTASYNPSKNEILLYCYNRGIADILRSLSHELVHFFQRETGELDDNFMDEISGLNDISVHQKLYDIEYQANGLGGVIFRQYKDYIKNKLSNYQFQPENGMTIVTNMNILKLNEETIFDLYSKYMQNEKRKENKKNISVLSVQTKTVIPPQKQTKMTNILRKPEIAEQEYKNTLDYLDELAEELKHMRNSAPSFQSSQTIIEFHMLFNKFFTELLAHHNFYISPNKQKGTIYEYIYETNNYKINVTIFPLGISAVYPQRGQNNEMTREKWNYPICSIVIRKNKQETVFDFDAKNLKHLFKKIKKILQKNIFQLKKP